MEQGEGQGDPLFHNFLDLHRLALMELRKFHTRGIKDYGQGGGGSSNEEIQGGI